MLRRGEHPVCQCRLDPPPSDQHVPCSVELMVLRAHCEAEPWTGAPAAWRTAGRLSQAGLRLATFISPTAAVRTGGAAGLTGPGNGATCRDPVRTAAALTARLTGGAVSEAGRLDRVG